MAREVIAMPLAPHVRQALLVAGIHTVDQAAEDELRAGRLLPGPEAAEVLRLAHNKELGWCMAGARTALQMAQQQQQDQVRRIRTSCPALDQLLGGGVARGAVTEFCGVPGVGKTQLGMQLALNVQLPPGRGGLGGRAVYIDSEGSFMADRAAEMAAAAAQGDPQAASALLEGMLHFRVADAAQQLGLMRSLPGLLARQPGVALVVVDSVALHLRQLEPAGAGGADATAARARLLAGLAQATLALAEQADVAVVLMNQVTTRVQRQQQAPTPPPGEEGQAGGGERGDAGAGQLVPALGETWGQAASTRVILFWRGPQRCAYLAKGVAGAADTVEFEVTAAGLRGAGA